MWRTRRPALRWVASIFNSSIRPSRTDRPRCPTSGQGRAIRSLPGRAALSAWPGRRPAWSPAVLRSSKCGIGAVRASTSTIVDPASGRSASFAVIPRGGNRFALRFYPPGVILIAPAYVTATVNAQGQFLTADLNDARLARFRFELVAPQAESLAVLETSASPTFRPFCADADLPATGTVTAQAALAAMAGPEAMALVLQKVGGLAIDKRLLAWPVDLDASQVAYEKKPLLAVSSADLRLKRPAGTAWNVAGAQLLVTGAEATLTWTDALTVTWHVEMEQGVEIRHGGTVPGARYSRSVSVPEYLVAVGVAEAEAGGLPIGKVLAVMLGSPGRAEQVMTNLPGALLLRGSAVGGRSIVQSGDRRRPPRPHRGEERPAGAPASAGGGSVPACGGLVLRLVRSGPACRGRATGPGTGAAERNGGPREQRQARRHHRPDGGVGRPRAEAAATGVPGGPLGGASGSARSRR